MKHTASIFLILAMQGLGGCYYDIEEELYPVDFCETENVTFSGTIKPLIQTRCALPGPCHGGGQTPNLTTDDAIKQVADGGRIKARVIDHVPTPMPPTGPLPPCEIQQIQAWLNAGAPITN